MEQRPHNHDWRFVPWQYCRNFQGSNLKYIFVCEFFNLNFGLANSFTSKWRWKPDEGECSSFWGCINIDVVVHPILTCHLMKVLVNTVLSSLKWIRAKGRACPNKTGSYKKSKSWKVHRGDWLLSYWFRLINIYFSVSCKHITWQVELWHRKRKRSKLSTFLLPVRQ